MNKVVGAWGCICSDCHIFEVKCMGCHAIEGKECEEIPCEKFWMNKNPNWTDEQHKKIVEDRTALLKELANTRDYFIKEISDPKSKSNITNSILRKLPDWFGIEEAIIEYVDKVKDTIFYAAFDNDKPIGFLSLKFNNEYTCEIYVMGIKKEYHNKGIGRELVERAISYLIKKNYKFLMVKTLGESHLDKNYKKTREFYNKLGFYPIEEIKGIWGEHNPCLIMVKSLYGGIINV
ncbi:GNAT family N-acetyltransferase [Schnuerera ultunensis]|uniref:Acetyltransferase (Modular protein) n=1 Tax=[Clostridium] ultunense Esp TaxID=1288971 RepID=A0A1M4PR68_9FIRM|nr:GNAT family N-acetyltransferase [Schnuerera ultunensis]SHD77974.1 Acetyltransferase (modular protein) [[Clostridium] ultunense Esp]